MITVGIELLAIAGCSDHIRITQLLGNQNHVLLMLEASTCRQVPFQIANNKTTRRWIRDNNETLDTYIRELNDTLNDNDDEKQFS